MHSTRAKLLVLTQFVQGEVQLRCVVLLLASIGARLITWRTPLGSSTSPAGTKPATIRRARTTFVRYGLFNFRHLSICVQTAVGGVNTRKLLLRYELSKSLLSNFAANGQGNSENKCPYGVLSNT